MDPASAKLIKGLLAVDSSKRYSVQEAIKLCKPLSTEEQKKLAEIVEKNLNHPMDVGSHIIIPDDEVARLGIPIL